MTERTGSASHAAPLAILLWVIVLAALAYGVVETARKVTALF